MKQFLLALMMAFSIAVVAQPTTEKIDAYLTAAQKVGKFNGSVLIEYNGAILLAKGYGYRNTEEKLSCDDQTIYQIGSVTKQFTATIILKLAEQKKLSLSDKLSKYFPEFPNAEKINIENLLSHTSGIFNYTNDADFMMKEVEKPIDRQKLFEMVKNKPLDFEPGTKYNYSNTGYMMLGYIIEKVTGRKYEQAVKQNIFIPLQMTHSGFDYKNLQDANRAVGYNVIVNGKGERAMKVDSTVSFSAGAMYTTVGDLNKWNRSLQTENILTKQSLQNAFTRRLSNYGLGWAIDSIGGKQMISHGGGIHGFLSYNTFIPADKNSVTLFTNVATTDIDKVTRDLIAIVYNKPYELPAEKVEVKIDESILKQYVGTYELAPTFSIVVRVDNGQLKAQATGQPEFELFAKNEKEFFLKVVDAQVEFVKNDKGEVEKMILHQGGQHMPGIKKK